MKKFFTLLSVAAMAITASAQASWTVTTETPLEGAQVITSVPGITATLGGEKCVDKTGADNGAAVWAKVSAGAISVDGVDFTHFIVSGDNARGEDFGSGTSDRVYGGFVKYVPSENGYLINVFQNPANKGLIFAVNNEENPTGVNMLLNGSAKVYDASGAEVTLSEAGVTPIADKSMLYIKAPLNAGNTYWFSFAGSKTSFGGFIFTPDPNAGLGNVNAENRPVEYFNLQGIRVANPENGLFIRRQGNTATKVIL